MEEIIKTPISEAKQSIDALGKKPFLWDYGVKVYSQNQEDGILYYLLSQLSERNGYAVELGAGDGIECNTGFLVREHGYTSYFIDGSLYWLNVGVKSYESMSIKGTPIFIYSWIIRENIIDLLDKNTIPKEIDVLSVDIDGNDYWILEEIMKKNDSIQKLLL